MAGSGWLVAARVMLPATGSKIESRNPNLETRNQKPKTRGEGAAGHKVRGTSSL